MASRSGARSAVAGVVGWVLAALVLFWAARFLLGTVFWLLRSVIVVAVLVGLAVLWFILKAPDVDE